MIQNREENQTVVIRFFKPASGWPKPFSRETFTHDIEVGVIGAILALPQAIALATLAGMPPEFGIYASVIPVLIALIWGSSWFTLSGPNTAVSVMLAATIIPFAAIGSDRFIELVFLLSLFVGLIQLTTGFLKLGVILDFISSTVILAVIQAVAIILVISAIFSICLSEVSSGNNIFSKLATLFKNLDSINTGTLLIGLITIAIGFLAKLIVPRYSLLIAMLVGTLAAFFISKSSVQFANNIPLLGSIPLSIDVWRVPVFDTKSLKIVAGQWDSAIAIAFLGLMQTVIISRSIAVKSGHTITTRRETIGQGFANTVAPFVSAFAGSGSFNRSATNYQAGAKTPYAGILGVLLLVVIVSLGQKFLGYIPKAVIAATLFLVGIGLFDFKQVKQIFIASAERWIFILTFASSLLLGLNVGVLVGVFSSLIVYLWHTSQPNIETVEYLSRNGKSVKAFSIDGNLFFGSIPAVENHIMGMLTKNKSNEVLVIKTDHLSYIDIPAGRLILKIISDAKKQSTDAYIYISRSFVTEVLIQAGMLDKDIDDVVIFKNKNHPMKSILHPYQMSGRVTMTKLEDTKSLSKKIKMTALLSSFSDKNVSALLENNPPRFAESGEIIVRRDEEMNDHIILIDGEVEIQRIWSVSDGNDKSHTWTISPINDIPSVLLAASSNVRARALTDIQYVVLNADSVDNLLGWVNHNQQSNPEHDSHTIRLMQQVVSSHHLPNEVLEKILTEMTPMDVEAGEVIIRETEKGDSYYLIENGEAEVIRTDPFTDETTVVNQIGSGDGFGEEALIQDGFRNATIRMLTPARLLVLSREAFEEHVQTKLLREISAEDAHERLKQEKIKLIDCRYDMEYEDCHLDNAILIPLHELRERFHELDSEFDYLVYCRSGRRSKAAAYLLQERNITATSIKGGIKDWPYEILYGDC